MTTDNVICVFIDHAVHSVTVRKDYIIIKKVQATGTSYIL